MVHNILVMILYGSLYISYDTIWFTIYNLRYYVVHFVFSMILYCSLYTSYDTISYDPLVSSPIFMTSKVSLSICYGP